MSKLQYTRVESHLGIFDTLPNERMSDMIRNGHHEPHVRRILEKYSNPKKWSIDVGACIGMQTVLLARNSRRVIAIEPNPMVQDWLKRNLDLNCIRDKVDVFQVGATDKPCIFPMNRMELGNYPNVGACGRSKKNKDDDVMVVGMTLDSIWEKEGKPTISVIKIDTEGQELEILKGAIQVITSTRPIVVAEISQTIHMRAILIFLSVWDYQIRWLGNNGWDYVLYPAEKGIIQ